MSRAAGSWPTEQVISAAQQGDPRAIATLVSGSHQHVQSFARTLCSTPEDAEDATQEALIVLYRRIGTLRATAALASWMFQIVRNECIRRSRLALHRPAPAAMLEPSAEDAALAHLEIERIVDSIAALPLEQRAVLVLRDIAATILAAGDATTIRAGNLVLHADGAFSPSALPKNKFAPVTFHGNASVQTADASHVPPVQTVHLQIDRHFRIESTGLPSCALAQITASSPSHAMKVCGPALIGKGRAGAQAAFPEQAFINAKGVLLAFNGPTIGGYPEMLFYTYVDVPAPTALVVVAKLSKDSGKYAYRITATVPELVGGYGSLTNFELTLGRKWTYKGAQHSYLSAECPDGDFTDQFEVAFGDGTNLSGTLVNSCQSKG